MNTNMAERYAPVMRTTLNFYSISSQGECDEVYNIIKSLIMKNADEVLGRRTKPFRATPHVTDR